MIPQELRDAAIEKGVRITKAGRVTERVRAQQADGSWKTYSLRARYMGMLKNATVVWCPWSETCNWNGEVVKHGDDFGPRLEEVIRKHLQGCAGFAADLEKAVA